jgi:hypothetical protein
MTESKRLPILCLDFDGVCHSYTSGWKGADTIPDEYVPGLFEFLEAVKDDFDVQVLSSRSHQPGGREAMMVWFIEQRKLWRSRGGMPPEDTPLTIGFPTEKPPAVVTLDDRGLLFTGVWPTVDELKSFKPWYLKPKRESLDERPGGKGECCSCGKSTIYNCPFCRVYHGKIVWLCSEPSCREQHEAAVSGGCIRKG